MIARPAFVLCSFLFSASSTRCQARRQRRQSGGCRRGLRRGYLARQVKRSGVHKPQQRCARSACAAGLSVPAARPPVVGLSPGGRRPPPGHADRVSPRRREGARRKAAAAAAANAAGGAVALHSVVRPPPPLILLLTLSSGTIPPSLGRCQTRCHAPQLPRNTRSLAAGVVVQQSVLHGTNNQGEKN